MNRIQRIVFWKKQGFGLFEAWHLSKSPIPKEVVDAINKLELEMKKLKEGWWK